MHDVIRFCYVITFQACKASVRTFRLEFLFHGPLTHEIASTKLERICFEPTSLEKVSLSLF